MSEIKIEHQPDQQRLDQLGITGWAVWEKEAAEFPWTYDAQETCYFLEGDVMVTTDDGRQYVMGKGDLVTFPSGLTCTWLIKRAVRKHYTFA